jgi:hypothetical protein
MKSIALSSKDQVILAYALWYGFRKRQEFGRRQDVAKIDCLPEVGQYEVVFRDHVGKRPRARASHPGYVKLPDGKRVHELFCSDVVAWRTDWPILNKWKYILGHNFIVIEKQKHSSR